MRFRIDLGRAFLAIVLAIALWIVIQNETNPERADVPNFAIPVEVVNTPPGLVVVSEPPQVQARVRIPSDSWSLLRPGSFRATADAAGADDGVNQLPVHIDALEQTVRGVDPVPPRITVVMEEVNERIVPVQASLIGSVPSGYRFDPPVRIVPEHVTVVGPSSAVQRVEAAVIEIRLDGLTVSLNTAAAVRAVDARGADVRSVRVSPPSVNVEVPVLQQIGYKEVGVRPVIRGRAAPGYYLQPVEVEPAAVTVVGSPSTLAGVNFVDTEPIDVGNISSTVVRRVQVVPPQGLSLLQPQPVNVTLRVSAVPITQTLRLTPTIQNLGANLQLASQIPPVDVTLVGPAPTFQSLTARDFRFVLDVNGLRAGSYDVEPRVVALPPDFSVERTDPPRVTVVLRDAPTPVPTPTRTEPAPPETTPTPGP